MIKVKTLTETCGACPSQWEGTLSNGDDLYIRYRYGYLSIRVNDNKVWGDCIGDSMDGCLSEYEMKPYLLKALKKYSETYQRPEDIDTLLFE